MILVDEGKIGLNDRVAAFIPGFERYGKANITIRHLLTHVSGLRPDVDLADSWSGSDTAIALAIEEVPASVPGTRFVYSDINFFLLGDIVRRVSGVAARSIFIQEDFCAARHDRHRVYTQPSRSRRPNRPDWRHEIRCAASFTIQRQDEWEALPVTLDSSAPRRTWRSSAGWFWVAASIVAYEFFLRWQWQG